MKIIVICQRGNVRSVTVASILKDYFGYIDVLSMGWQTTSVQTANMLLLWANRVVLAGGIDIKDGLEPFMDILGKKQITWLSGIDNDTWGRPMHIDLVRTCLQLLENSGFEKQWNVYNTAVDYENAVRKIN